MKHLLPTNLELLVELAAAANLEYQDAYYVWTQVHKQESAYLIVETVLYVAKMHKLPISLALMACQMRPYWHREYQLIESVTVWC